MSEFQPHHLCFGRDEVSGNDGRGRVFFIPGSAARVQRLAAHFHDAREFASPRQIDAWIGEYREDGFTVDVGAISTGMGCPSLGIVVTELLQLGVRRLTRVGSSGSLQRPAIGIGDLVIATGAVRDEGASDAWAPREYPAVAHPDWVAALQKGARVRGLQERTYLGLAHSKDSLYGREFPMGPLAEKNRAYMRCLTDLGVLATEMETAHLFVLAACHNRDLAPISRCAASPEAVKAGSLLAIVGDEAVWGTPGQAQPAEEAAVQVALSAAVALIKAEDEA